jgi:hypothetical protein
MPKEGKLIRQVLLLVHTIPNLIEIRELVWQMRGVDGQTDMYTCGKDAKHSGQHKGTQRRSPELQAFLDSSEF